MWKNSLQIRNYRNQFSGPNNGDWNYSYESENGIKQEARGEMKSVGDALVSDFPRNKVSIKRVANEYLKYSFMTNLYYGKYSVTDTLLRGYPFLMSKESHVITK